MRQFVDFKDLTGKGRKLQCYYHGSDAHLRLEGRITSETSSGLEVGISLWGEDVVSHTYDGCRKSLNVWYQSPPPNTIRVAILKMEKFDVPDSIQEINVYDVR